jgi:hypothetical protein
MVSESINVRKTSGVLCSVESRVPAADAISK